MLEIYKIMDEEIKLNKALRMQQLREEIQEIMYKLAIEISKENNSLGTSLMIDADKLNQMNEKDYGSDNN